ncbi:MAG TPA: cation transporter [Mycobacteriales bacterium]|nr:cation transporter [Mycobacteriales bacterium]
MPLAEAPPAVRSALLGRARALAAFSLAWNVGEGVIALVAAWASGSRALGAFGVDSGVESISAAVLLWRLGVERRDPQRAEIGERRALRAIGLSFLALAALVMVEALRSLALREEPSASRLGIALTALSLVVMPFLARAKRRVAVDLGSRAAEADSAQTTACAYLSAVVLVGLALNATLGWWWADPVAALGVVWFLVAEGREAMRSEHLDDCCG